MKKLYFIFVALILNCTGMLAQFSIYASVGANYSNFNSILFGREFYDDAKPWLKYQLFPILGLELRYKKGNIGYSAGLNYSYRGYRDYSNSARVFEHVKYVVELNGYCELPLTATYYFKNNIIGFGIGVSPHLRTYIGTVYQHEVGQHWGWDARVLGSVRLTKRFELAAGYTLGNFDKYLKNTYGVFMHHVFSMQVKYRLF